ncbi:MAG: parallel beta-helix domain-containing protein [Flavisolibacter sp.]
MKSFPTTLLQSSALRTLFAIAISTMFLSSCKKEANPPQESDRPGPLTQTNERTGFFNTRVSPGGSIQAAVDAAHPGFIIMIDAGIYNEAVVVNKPGILLVGATDGVIIQNPGGKENGVTATDLADGFVLKNLTVRNFEENGVYLDHVNGFLLSNVTTINNGEYGLFPVFSTNGIIEHCSASGHSDTGIYVGQSSNVSISNNVVTANVNGLEVENSKNVVVAKNQSYDNVAGLLVILLPGLEVKSASDVLVFKNNIFNNNHTNFAPPGGGFESIIPKGVGILVLGADRTKITENNIYNNDFTGIAVVSTAVLGSLAGLPPSAFADIEPNPDGNQILKNVLTHNGTAPTPGFPFPGVDLLWDGTGTGNCWSLNTFSTLYPSPLPTCN